MNYLSAFRFHEVCIRTKDLVPRMDPDNVKIIPVSGTTSSNVAVPASLMSFYR